MVQCTSQEEENVRAVVQFLMVGSYMRAIMDNNGVVDIVEKKSITKLGEDGVTKYGDLE